VTLLLSLAPVSCGYTLVGRGAFLPEYIRTVAIPTFANETPRFEVEIRLTDAVSREFVSRGNFRLVADPTEADAVLEGTIIRFSTRPVGLGAGEQARNYQVLITTSIVFRDLVENEIVFSNNALLFRDEYELEQDPGALIDFEILAVEAIADEFARSVVSSILEGF